MDSLNPTQAETLQELQKHKENVDKATRLIVPLLENVNFLLLKNSSNGISGNGGSTTVSSAVGITASDSSSKINNITGDESGSVSLIDKSASSLAATGLQTTKVATDDGSYSATSSFSNIEGPEFAADNSASGLFYEADSASNKSPKHGLQDTPSRLARNRRSGGHHVSSSIVKSIPEPKKGKSFFSSQYNPSDPILIGSEVAFKLRYGEWIQCVVTKIIDSTKFEVTDPEPDENNNPGKTYKTNWKEVSLVPPVKYGKLQHYPVGTKVIARYPETTTFYPAEVIGTKRDGKCRLRFDGEEEVGKETEVERRLVLPYPSR